MSTDDFPIWFLIACFVLDPTTPSGLRWRERPREHFPNIRQWHRWNTRYAGKQAGSLDRGDGYFRIVLTYRGRERRRLAHRIVFALVHGRWPSDQLDHREGVKAGNGIDNLREATRSENNQNHKLRSTNTSGFPGVHWHKRTRMRTRKWVASISANGRTFHLGYFATPEAAHAAYLAAKARLHPFQPVPRALGSAEAES